MHDATMRSKTTAKDIVVAKTLFTGSREGGVIGDLVFDAETAEPAIGEVQLHFAAERALGADREHVIPG